MDPDTPKPTVIYNPDDSRFEIHIDNYTAVLDYSLHGSTMLMTHTVVPSELGGRGLGGLLAQAGLDYAREKGYKVEPLCSFVAAYIRKNPQYQDLL